MSANNQTDLEGVALLGPYPPPYGGVSVHVRRLHQGLRARGIESRVACQMAWTGSADGVSPRTPSISHRLRLWRLTYPDQPIRESLVHCHDSWVEVAPSLRRLVAKGHRLVVTVHGERSRKLLDEIPRMFRSSAFRLAEDRRVRWIAVSDRIARQLVHLGVDGDRIETIPAFIPPIRVPNATQTLPTELEVWQRDRSPLVSFYAHTLQLWGEDVYGVDFAVKAVAALRNEYPNLGFVMCLPTAEPGRELEELQGLLRDHRLDSSTLTITRPLSDAYPLWDMSDVYFRPTRTDGDSLAVREALSLGVPVVTTDAAQRPNGCVVFETDDLEGCLGAFRTAIARGKVGSTTTDDEAQGLTRIVAVYAKCLGRAE